MSSELKGSAARTEAPVAAPRREPSVATAAVVYLVRHGRTALNQAGRLRGRIDVPLDDVGCVEATALGALFRNVPPGVVVSSPLVRALETAQPIADTLGVSVSIEDALIDRDYGDWAGCTSEELESRFGSVDAVPGVESAAAVGARAAVCLERLAAIDGPVVAVAHDAVNRTVLARLVPALGDPDHIPQRTGCWNRLERRPGGWWAPVIDAVPHDGRRP